MAILAVNAGSSSLKFSVHLVQDGDAQPSVLTGNFQGLEPGGTATLDWSFNGDKHSLNLPPGTKHPFTQAMHSLVDLLAAEPTLPSIRAIAHRVVHGGKDFSASVIVTEEILARLASLNSLAPLHQPHNLQGIREFKKTFPDTPQVACFDTAFHATLKDAEFSFALPRELTDQGVRRYGFHGLSYQFITSALRQHSARAQGRVLMAHLGNGASLCATREGRSCATTMGFSTLDGLIMGTRSGSLDPGVLLYLLEQGWDHARLQTLLYKQSGMLGLSGISADMRALRADASPAARRAIELFTHRVARESGALSACIGGLDALTFSGGIGEHDAQLRADVCEQLAWMGVKIDAGANRNAIGNAVAPIHSADSRVEVWMVPTDEGVVAAREAVGVIGSAAAVEKRNNS